jgi:ferritin
MQPRLSPPVLKGLNEAIGNELFAHSLYLNLANVSQSIGYFGVQKYFLAESASELAHYQKLVNYTNDRGDLASVPAIPPQPERPSSIKEMFEIALQAEGDLEDFYVEFYEKCEEPTSDGGYGDCVTAQFLLKFIEIQRKSIGEIRDLLATIQRCGNNEAALLIFDNKLNGL